MSTKKTPRVEVVSLEDSDNAGFPSVVHVEPSDELFRGSDTPTEPPHKPTLTRCDICAEYFEGTSTDHFLARHA